MNLNLFLKCQTAFFFHKMIDYLKNSFSQVSRKFFASNVTEMINNIKRFVVD